MQKLMTLAEAAELLDVDYARAAQLARDGMLRPAVVRIGRQVRINPVLLREIIERGGEPLPGGWRRKPQNASAAA
ncbi:MAG TPA: helix-turn-helix domain-containing protein [Blastocatellia bacterium]|nr:helix-turn-helix domain-containing protein [Blastocatellia bacterium]